MKPATLALIRKIAQKLNQKSSVYGYLMVLGGAFLGTQDQLLIAKISAAIALVAGAVLFLASDEQVAAFLTGKDDQETPPPEDKAP